MSPDYTSDEMAFVAVTPDHIDVFSLHAVFSFYFFYFFILFYLLFHFIIIYFIYYILFYFNIYLLNEEEEH